MYFCFWVYCYKTRKETFSLNLLNLFIGDPDCFSNWNIMKTGRAVEIDEELHSSETSCISFCSYPNNMGEKLLNAHWSIMKRVFFLNFACEEGKITCCRLVLGLPSNSLCYRVVVAKKLKVCQQAWFSMPWYVCAKIKFKLTSFARLWRLILCQH